MADQKFVRAPRQIPMMLWDGTNWDEVKAFFEARGFTGAVIGGGKYLLVYGLFAAMGTTLPTYVLDEQSGPAWLMDYVEATGKGYVPETPPVTAIAVGEDGDPVGYRPA